MIPDLINGLFELIGGILCCMNISQIYKDKSVRGVHIILMLFFAAWEFWNLWYYPFLNQWLSFVGGISIVIANIVWIALYFIYKRREKNGI